MHAPSFIPISFMLSLLPRLTYSVNVEFGFPARYTDRTIGFDDPTVAQKCRNLRPGRCCQARPIQNIWAQLGVPDPDPHPPTLPNYRSAQWTDLAALDIAAVWSPVPGNPGACAGRPVGTAAGPGAWRYPPAYRDSETLISGASYLRVPTGMPKDVDAPWMEAQGILGLVTGGGDWVSDKTSEAFASRLDSFVMGMSVNRLRTRGQRKREIVSAEKGTVFAQPPAEGRSVWPDLIVVNGTEYTQEGEGSPVYKSEGGVVLNMIDAGG